MTSKELRKQRRREEHNARKEANRTGQLAPLVRDEETNAQQQSSAAPIGQPSRAVLPERIPFTDPAWGNPYAFPPQMAAYVKSVGDRMVLESGFGPNSERRLAPENAAEEPDAPSPAPTAHTERNRKNAQLSTGPKTPEGKAQASQNAFRHGLASNQFLILPWESTDGFDNLLDNLRAEHQPSTQTEALLVEKMAEHFWLSQRALRLQDMCFRREGPICDQPKDLALYIRYGTTHDRAFHKCLAELGKLRAAKQKTEAGFVSQKRQEAAETRKAELHQEKLHAARVAVLTSKKCAKEQISERKAPPAPASVTSSAAKQPQEMPSVLLERTEALAQVSSQAA